MIRQRRPARVSAGILLAGLVATAAVAGLAGNATLAFATNLACWIALTESWLILSGYAGYISLGHAVFVGTGAYVFVLTWGMIPVWQGFLAAASASGLLACLIGLPCLRVRGPYFVILTLGVAELAKNIVINIEASLGMFGRLLMDGPGPRPLFLLACGLAAAAFVLSYAVRHSRLGIGLLAIRENETAAEMTGVPTVRLKIVAFVLSAIIPGMVGCVMVARSGYFEPLQIFSPQISLTIVTTCIIGGIDDAPGPVLGAVFLNLLSQALWEKAPQLYMVILGVLLIAFVLKMPDGLYGWLMRRRRVA
jgi:branched-chain amino acid transport system permease protein